MSMSRSEQIAQLEKRVGTTSLERIKRPIAQKMSLNYEVPLTRTYLSKTWCKRFGHH